MLILNRFVLVVYFSSEWKSAIRDKKCPCKTNANARAKYLIERLRDSWQHLLRDRATRSLTYNDEQFHSLEKIKVINLICCALLSHTIEQPFFYKIIF